MYCDLQCGVGLTCNEILVGGKGMLSRSWILRCNARRGPGHRKFEMDPVLKAQLSQIPDFMSHRSEGRRPVAFATAAPAPLRGRQLSQVHLDESALSGNETTAGDVMFKPVANIDASLMGFPPFLMERLASFGVHRLTPVQSKLFTHCYANFDAAVCGPTGSGKTLGLCIAVISKLMRQGPMNLLSTIVMVPSDILAAQVNGWLHDLWRFPGDPQLTLVLRESEGGADKLLRLIMDDDTVRTEPWLHSNDAPYIVVATPSVLWAAYATKMQLLVDHPLRRQNVSQLRVLPTVDSIFIDEVDAVLPHGNRSAPGNMLLADLVVRNKYEAPLQTIMTSATLAPSTVNHVRRFMKKSIFADLTAQVFENDDAEVLNSSVHQAMSGRTMANRRGVPRPSPKAGNRDEVAANRLLCPPTVQHRFFVANTAAEQVDALNDMVKEVVETAEFVAMQSTSYNAEAEAHVVDHRRAAAAAIRAVVVIDPSMPFDQFTQNVIEKLEIPGRVADHRKLAVNRFRRSDWDTTIDGDAATGPVFLPLTTDVVRGVDVEAATHVVFVAHPASALDYVHWAGRIGRLGAAGTCVVLMRRQNVRHVTGYCESIGVDMKIKRRRYSDVPEVASARYLASDDN